MRSRTAYGAIFAASAMVVFPRTVKAAGQGVLDQMMQAINSTQGQSQIDLSNAVKAFSGHNQDVDRAKGYKDPRTIVIPEPAPGPGVDANSPDYLKAVAAINQTRGLSGNAAEEAFNALQQLDGARNDLNTNVRDRLQPDLKSLGTVAQVNQAYAALQQSVSGCPTVTYTAADNQKLDGAGQKQDVGAIDQPAQDAQSAVTKAGNALTTCSGDASNQTQQQTDEQKAQQAMSDALQKVNSMRKTAANEVNFLNTQKQLDMKTIASAQTLAQSAVNDANSALSQLLSAGSSVNQNNPSVGALRTQNAQTLLMANQVVAVAKKQLQAN